MVGTGGLYLGLFSSAQFFGSRVFAKDRVNRMIRISRYFLAVALATLPSAAQAEILFVQNQLLISNSENNFTATQFDLDIVFLDNQLFPTNLVRLFDSAIISVTGGVRIFESTAATDSNFAEAVLRLTGAPGEFIQTVLTEDQVGGLSESRGTNINTFFLFGNFPNPSVSNRLQLANATIDRFQLEVKEFDLSPTGSTGPTAPVNFLAEFTIYGTLVPEPSTGLLAFTALAVLAAKGRRFVRE